MKTQLNKIIRLIPLTLLLLSGCSNSKIDANKQLRIYNNVSRLDEFSKNYQHRDLKAVFYFGTYNDYDIVYYKFKMEAELDAMTEYVLNGFYFVYGSTKVIMAVNDSEMITLVEAYNSLYVNNENIATIYRYYTNYFHEYLVLVNSGGHDGFYDFTNM